MRLTLLAASALLISGCISYDGTHALVTPFGAAGYHTFAPRDRPSAVDEAQAQQRLAESRDRERKRDTDDTRT